MRIVEPRLRIGTLSLTATFVLGFAFVSGSQWIGWEAGAVEPLATTGSPQQSLLRQGFIRIFDGRSLTGWHAVPAESQSDWSVRDGVLIGQGSADRLAYLVWNNDKLTDFDLRLRYRLPGKGNTGVEIRARRDVTGKRPFEGYHADLGHVGIGPHILGAWDFHFVKRREAPCPRGTRLVMDPEGNAHASEIRNAVTLSDIHPHQWNAVRIVARGNRFQFYLNGKLASEFVDNARQGRLDQGAIGLQIHDKAMRVEFRDIYLKQLQGERRDGPTQASRSGE